MPFVAGGEEKNSYNISTFMLMFKIPSLASFFYVVGLLSIEMYISKVTINVQKIYILYYIHISMYIAGEEGNVFFSNLK